jgi:hypothetical protein
MAITVCGENSRVVSEKVNYKQIRYKTMEYGISTFHSFTDFKAAYNTKNR